MFNNKHMNESIFQLVYTSQALKPITAESLNDILTISRKNNSRDGITGFLALRNDYFLQLLEGEESKVRECFSRISTDARHRMVTVQGEVKTSARTMPGWSMGRTASGASAIELIELFELGLRGEVCKSSTQLMAMVKMFIKNAKIMD